MYTKRIIIICILLAVLVGGFYRLNSYIYMKKQGDGQVSTTTGATIIKPEQITLTGTQVCLPHRDTRGPQTLECAFGMLTTAGDYYALDLTLMSQTLPPSISSGATFTASGLMTPTEALSSDHWQKYTMKGIVSVTSVIIMTPPAPEQPSKQPGKQSATGPCYVGGCSGEVCSGEKDVASNCIYREEFACYKNTQARCERQAQTGTCGWTPTATLNACLSASVSIY